MRQAPSTASRSTPTARSTPSIRAVRGSRPSRSRSPMFQAPTNPTSLPGNVYMPSTDFGAVQVGFSTAGGMGTIVSGALVSSTVDPRLRAHRDDRVAARLYGHLVGIPDRFGNSLDVLPPATSRPRRIRPRPRCPACSRPVTSPTTSIGRPLPPPGWAAWRRSKPNNFSPRMARPSRAWRRNDFHLFRAAEAGESTSNGLG